MKATFFYTTTNIIVLLTVGLLFLTVATTSCYYDKEEILYPQSVCDTTNVTYSSSVVSILVCASAIVVTKQTVISVNKCFMLLNKKFLSKL